MLPFDIVEYQNRLSKTKQRMAESGIEVLLITDPANMNYLTGYDAWSFYVHQMLIVIIDEPQPIWVGRYQDANGAKATTWIYDDNVIAYPDYYVQSSIYHPMDFVAEILKQIGHGNRYTGVEMDNYYFSAKAYERLTRNLPNAKFKDGGLLVNYVRIIKSNQELEYMERAAEIADKAMYEGANSIRSGIRECDVAANIYYHMVSGTEKYGGDYPAIVPLLPAGENTGAPHLTWSDRKFKEGESVIIELAGCYKRYHVPLARTVSIGKPSDQLQKIKPVVIEGLNEVLDGVKPGMTCGDVENIWRSSLKKHGIEKEARLGYSVGLNYPPDWGEHTASIRMGDSTVLQPNMTFHLIPALWFDDYGIEISETFRVTESGCLTFSNYPRDLIIQEPFDMNRQGGRIS
ncbi:M24 family metallopeptidase [Aquibacillus rhizosphaerae]|uniref:M24 family metallopeptidase n=1 Tax=Aquibacillus rhizosphaerae TaxID=3051431 RepID=A0ABT7L5A6_9BACI|nr:M24 family metallopeptidase [Aquibacillus sp. LR5S19]MDL4841036.1 M24 family metallopeptidase [Aquibacillus sp. LR5S19]